MGCGARTGLGVEESDSGSVDDSGLEDASMADASVPPLCEGATAVVRYVDGVPDRRSVSLRATVQIAEADAYFLFDTTGSMIDEIAAMRATVLDLVDTLTCPTEGRPCSDGGDCGSGEQCSPTGVCGPEDQVRGCLPDLHVGVGRYAGRADTYRHLRSPSPPSAALPDAIPAAANGVGAAESLYQSVSCIGRIGRCGSAGCVSGRGCPGFRPGALPIVVAITDEGDQCSARIPPECLETLDTAVEAMGLLEATFVGISADPRGGEAEDFLRAIAIGTDSTDVNGEPLVFVGSGSAVVDAVRSGLRSVGVQPLDLRVALQPLEGDALQYVDHIRIDRESPGCFAYRDTEDEDGDGWDDTVLGAGPGTTGCFEVTFVDRAPRPASEEPQAARVRATLTGDGAVVDQQFVCVVY